MSQYGAYRRTKQSDLYKVYERAEDKNVSTVVVFADDSHVCCADKDHKHEIDQDTLANLFMKGFVIAYADLIFKPITAHKDEYGVTVIAITTKEVAEQVAVTDAETHTSEPKREVSFVEFYSRNSSLVEEDPEEEA